MTAMPSYCSNCGTPLRQGVRFCGQCGQPVQPLAGAPAQLAPQPMPASPQAGAEPIVAILPALGKRKGFLGMGTDNYSLLLTPTRMVFAHFTNRMMQEAVAAARAEAKSEGRGFFGQWAAQMGWLDVLARQFQQLPVDTILAQYPGSFFIPNAQVRRVRVEQPDADDDEPTPKPELTVEATGGKFRFTLSGMGEGDARGALQQTLGYVVQ